MKFPTGSTAKVAIGTLSCMPERQSLSHASVKRRSKGDRLSFIGHHAKDVGKWDILFHARKLTQQDDGYIHNQTHTGGWIVWFAGR